MAIVDCDTDKADAYKWLSQSPELKDHVYQYDYSESKNQYFTEFKNYIDKLKSEYDVIVFDTPPDGSEYSVIYSHWLGKLSDHVIVPFTPSGMDVSSIRKVIDVCNMENKPYSLLRCRWNAATVISDILEEEYSSDGRLLKSYIPQSVHFVESESSGVSPFEYNKNSKFNSNLLALAEEVLKEANYGI